MPDFLIYAFSCYFIYFFNRETIAHAGDDAVDEFVREIPRLIAVHLMLTNLIIELLTYIQYWSEFVRHDYSLIVNKLYYYTIAYSFLAIFDLIIF